MTNDVLWFVKPSLAFEWSTLYYLDIRQRKQEWLQTNILRRNSKKINAKLKIGPRVAAIAQWIHLRLPSRRPGFEYQTHQLRFYQIIFDLRHVEKTKINKKRSGLAHFKNLFCLFRILCCSGYLGMKSLRSFIFYFAIKSWSPNINIMVVFWSIDLALKRCCILWKNLYRKKTRVSGCGTVARAVTSDNRGLPGSNTAIKFLYKDYLFNVEKT